MNAGFVIWLLAVRGWWMPALLGVPFIVPPLLAVIALVAGHRERGV